MGLFDKIFGGASSPKGQVQGYFDTLTAYRPAFTSWSGGLYESELVRAAIHTKATHCSKLIVECFGAAQPQLRTRLRKAPNSFQTWSQFIYRTATILEMQNNCFIVPVCNEYGETVGLFPVLPSSCEILQYKGEPWIKYHFNNGQFATLALSECGVLTKFQYEDDIFGADNRALGATMKLIDIQNQGITEGIKSAATYRFMAQMNNFAKAEDLAKERQRFSERNLQEGGGLLLFPNTYTNIQQINSKPFVVDADQMRIIKDNCFNYFGLNEDVIQSKCFGDAWAAFYEGCVEPFAIQLSEVLTKMLFTDREIAAGSGIIATANRLQYMSNADKLNVSAQMADRGIMSINEIRQIWNLAPVDGGDVRTMRGEYKNAGEEPKEEVTENEE